MTETCECLACNVGVNIPNFKLKTFDPVQGDFSEISLQTIKKNKKWTILFFYPADFTFV